MKSYFRIMHGVWIEDDGALAFEWVLLVTLLVLGIVGGVAAVRDALVDELGDVTQATVNIDQSFTLPGVPELGVPDMEFVDPSSNYHDCDRTPIPNQQTENNDGGGS